MFELYVIQYRIIYNSEKNKTAQSKSSVLRGGVNKVQYLGSG